MLTLRDCCRKIEEKESMHDTQRYFYRFNRSKTFKITSFSGPVTFSKKWKYLLEQKFLYHTLPDRTDMTLLMEGYLKLRYREEIYASNSVPFPSLSHLKIIKKKMCTQSLNQIVYQLQSECGLYWKQGVN